MHINEFARMNHERSMKNDAGGVFDWIHHSNERECGELLNYLKKIKRGDFPLNKSMWPRRWPSLQAGS